jgi:hypothetical protein
MALDAQRLLAGLDDFGPGPELALALPLEPVERAGEVADDEVEVPVAVPIDRERPGKDVCNSVDWYVSRNVHKTEGPPPPRPVAPAV